MKVFLNGDKVMKVLTIDFDTIMEPCINFYNDMVGGDEALSEKLTDYPFIAENLPSDLYKYSYLTRLIASLHAKKVYFISTHQNVLPILKNLYDEPVEVINIDHHHDIGYEVVNWNRPLHPVTCGNWVKNGKDDGLINHYTWVYNENSDDADDVGSQKYIDEKVLFKTFSMKPLPPDVDAIIICASWEWLPERWYPLYYTWIGMLEEVNHTTYRIDNFEKK